MEHIPYSKPSITELELKYAADAAANGWGKKCHDYINRFAQLFGQHLGVEYVIPTSSCTGALHMGMAALDIGPGDEVILADTNWVATVAPIIYLGAKPVFVDIDPLTWCIDPDKVEKAINKNTKAIIAVHLYGNLCDMHHLSAIGQSYNIPIIEDAAEAIGSSFFGSPAGTMGKFGTFSFHGTKTITTGEGGAFVTNDPKLYEQVLTLSNHGRTHTQHKQFWADRVGFKYKMSNIQAAIGCGQVERITELINRRREILAFYREHFVDMPSVRMNFETPDMINGAWMPTVVFASETGVTRQRLLDALKARHIDGRVFFWPLSSLPMFEVVDTNVNSRSISNRAINLPSFHDITKSDLKRVIETIKILK